jgi:surfeit locus 1 family protein
MRLAFRFRVIPFVATVALVVLGIVLGNWQTRRAEEKLGIATKLAEHAGAPAVILGGRPMADLEYRRVRVTGEWVADWPLFLDNRPLNGKAGFILAMPFKIAGSKEHVLVLRGWLPRDAREYGKLPSFATPGGTVTIEGVAVLNAGHVMQLGTPGALKPGTLVQNLTPDAVAQASGLALQPFFVQQTGAGQGEGLVREWPAPNAGVDKHRGYAFQWYALALMAALFFVITGFRSGRKQGV